MWYTSRDGKTYGPFPEQQIQDFIASGKLTPEDFVWKDGMSDWLPAHKCFRFPQAAPPAPPVASQDYPNPYSDAPPPKSTVASVPPDSPSRIGAALLAIFLGGLGIHKFYMGYSTAGVIMLAITIFSCGFGVVLVGILGLIEGILYISMNDAQFYRTYVQNRKEWM